MQNSKSPRALLLKDDRPQCSHPHNQSYRSRVMCGDFRERLKRQPAGSIDAIITDPPYGVTDLDYDRKTLDIETMWRLIDRVTKPTATVVVFTCQPFTTAVINARPRAFRYELIWRKNKVTGFLSANRRPLRDHENILIFCRDLKGAVYNPQMTVGAPYFTRKRQKCQHYHGHNPIETVNDGFRYPRTVQAVDCVAKDRIHPSEKPIELLRWLVMTYSQPGDLICDPFMGSASTGEASLSCGRRFIGVEQDPGFYSRACGRLKKVSAEKKSV